MVKKNQLLLTSFYAIQKLSNVEINAFFKKLVNIGVSGIVVKVNRLINHTPDWFTKLCINNKIPLIELKTKLTYETIMLAIYQPILDHQSLILKSYYKTRQKLLSLDNGIESYQYLVSEFSNISHFQLILHMNSKYYKSKNFPKHYMITEQQAYLKYHYKFIKNRYYTCILENASTNEKQNATKIAFIGSDIEQSISLLVTHNEKMLHDEDIMLFENFIDIIQNKIKTTYALKQKKYNQLNDLADAILQSPLLNANKLNVLLNNANLDHFKFYQGIAFYTSEINNIDKNNIRKIISDLKKYSIFSEHHDYTIILFNLNDHISTVNLKQLLSSYFQKYSNLSLTLSTMKTKENIQNILDECLEGLNLNSKIFIDNVVDIEKLGIFRYFLSLKDPMILQQYIPRDLQELQQKHHELFKTLKVFFDKNQNYNAAAKKLFVHEKTVRYRIKKIQKILRLNINDPLSTINYQISTYLLGMKEEN